MQRRIFGSDYMHAFKRMFLIHKRSFEYTVWITQLMGNTLNFIRAL